MCSSSVCWNNLRKMASAHIRPQKPYSSCKRTSTRSTLGSGVTSTISMQMQLAATSTCEICSPSNPKSSKLKGAPVVWLRLAKVANRTKKKNRWDQGLIAGRPGRPDREAHQHQEKHWTPESVTRNPPGFWKWPFRNRIHKSPFHRLVTSEGFTLYNQGWWL